MSHSKRQVLKFLPLNCMAKEYNGESEISGIKSTEKQPFEVPEPIDEFIDYTIDIKKERCTQRTPETVDMFPGDREEMSTASDSERPAVEEIIEVSVLGQAETGLNMTRTKSSKKKPVRRAEGLSNVSDKSPRDSELREPLVTDHLRDGAMSHLQELMMSDAVPDEAEAFVAGSQSLQAPVRESAASIRTAETLGASQSATETARSHSGSADPSDVQALKRTLRRLTSELSRLLTAPRADGRDEAGGRKLLPCKGPLPPWLCDPRVFAPLMAAYDEQLSAGGGSGCDSGEGGSGGGTDARLLDMEARVLDVVRENERLRVKLREAATAGPASQTEWDAFTEQAKLVLEENQLLMHQLNVQQEKAKLAQRGYIAEAVKLRCRIEELEAENAQVRSEFDGMHGKLQEVKSKYQSAALERETGEMKTVDSMRSLSKELYDTREEFVRASEELLRQLQKSEREKVKLTRALSEVATERDSLQIEVSELKGAMQLRHKEHLQLQKSARKRDALQECLESVVSAAANLQEELDVCKEKMDDQETQLAKLVSYLVNELKHHEKAITGQAFEEESLDKIPKLASKFELVIKRFAALLKGNEDKREQMDKQICYLQSLIRQKSQELQYLEAEHRTVQAGLETVWSSAVSN